MEATEGMRVRAIHFTTINSSIDDNLTVPPGTEGTVHMVDDFGTVHVKWDNGACLGLLKGRDQWDITEKEHV